MLHSQKKKKKKKDKDAYKGKCLLLKNWSKSWDLLLADRDSNGMIVITDQFFVSLMGFN